MEQQQGAEAWGQVVVQEVQKRRWGVGSGCLVVVSVLLLLAGFFFGIAAIVSPPPERGALAAVLVFFVLPLFAFGGISGAVAVLLVRRVKQASITVYERGIVQVHENGERLQLAWEQVEAFSATPEKIRVRGVEVSVPYVGVVHGPRSFKLVISGYAKGREIGDQVRAIVYPRLRERLWAQVNQGQEVHFGNLRFAPEGIFGLGLMGGLIRWQELDHLFVDGRGMLSASIRGNPIPRRGPSFVDISNNIIVFEVVDWIQEKVGAVHPH